MTTETFILVTLVIVMLIGSYLAGSIPLVMKLSEEKLKLVTVLGAGLLVGTALTVIIPEGIRSLYVDVSIPAIIATPQTVNIMASNIPLPNPTLSDVKESSHHLAESHKIPDHTRTIGLSLVLGFVFMMLVDQVSQRKSATNEENITATVGLVVHAAADGVALGAAATTSHQDVEIIVFLAIMLHKAPAAFGLVSFLLHEKIERLKIRKHLAVFSLSAPLFALLTYFGIGQEQKETLNSVNATGIAMLFSAGTFLYVATVHVLPELTHGSGHSHGSQHISQYSQYEYRALESNAVADSGVITDARQRLTANSIHTKGLRNSELLFMVFGALLPLIITFSHSH